MHACCEENQKTSGPLHGLPISLKDQFHVQGVETTMGYAGWIGRNENTSDGQGLHNLESDIVRELLEFGAVLYYKVDSPRQRYRMKHLLTRQRLAVLKRSVYVGCKASSSFG